MGGQILAMDAFGVILTVRFPGAGSLDLTGCSTVNVFRHIFAELSGDQSILDTQVSDNSYMYRGGDKRLYLGVKDSIPLERWEPFMRPGSED